MFNFKIFSILFFLALSLTAQVIIPFGFWQKIAPLPLTVSPSGTQYILPGDLLTFNAAGETGTYTWTVSPAGAAAGSTVTTPGSSSDYTGRLDSYTTDTVTVASTTSLNITVITYNPLSITPTLLTMPINDVQTFIVADGYCFGVPGQCTAATSTWSIVSGGGTISTMGLFTAPAAAGTTIVQVTDSIGNVSQATITIVNTLTIIPLTLKLPVYSTRIYTAILGTTPFTYAVTSGAGAVGCNTNLNGALTNAMTTITVISTTGCPRNGVILVENEQICYTGLTATAFIGTAFGGGGVVRGCNGTVAAAHVTALPVNLNQTIHTAPATIGSGSVRVTDILAATSDSTITYIKPVEIASGYSFICALYNEGSVKCWGGMLLIKTRPKSWLRS